MFKEYQFKISGFCMAYFQANLKRSYFELFWLASIVARLMFYLFFIKSQTIKFLEQNLQKIMFLKKYNIQPRKVE